MYRNRQNIGYRNYSYLPPLTSIYSPNTQFQYYYHPHLFTQQSLHSNTTSIATYTSSRFRPQYKTSTSIFDLAEPLSSFDDLKFPRHRRSSIVPFPSTYIPPDVSRRTSINDTRLATVNTMREQLLIDIQHNINEIDQELSSLERRPTIARYSPLRLSSINKKAQPYNDDNRRRTKKSKRVYDIIPRIKSEKKQISQHSAPKLTNQAILQRSTRNLTNQAISQHSAPKLTNQVISQTFLGRYHYGPEIEEVEIRENDTENIDMKSIVDELPQLSFRETLSLDQFRREQSPVPQNRALIFVPEYGDNSKIGYDQTAADLHQNDPITTNTVQLSTVSSPRSSRSSKKLNIQDFEQLVQTAPKPTVEISLPNAAKPDELPNKTESDAVNTKLSQPDKYSSSSIEILTDILEEYTLS